MPDNPRIEELRRRVQKDPASIAFAQLAEELRRVGDFEEAVRVCRTGLEQHPAYLSARVTLGRALMELGRLDEAQGEFEHVLLGAPDNLVALRSMATLHQRRDSSPETEPQQESRLDPEPDSTLDSTPVLTMPPPDPVLAELEGWLAAIVTDRR